MFHLEHQKYHAWQFLFWIEGGATVTFAIIALLWLPLSPAKWWFLTERQKALARHRILSDSSVTVDEKLNIKDAFSPFKDGIYWVWAFISLCLGVPLASVNNFLPQIVASLGYSTVKTNLYTVAPNIVGTVCLVAFTFSSDYFRERSIHICIPLAITLIGFVILGSIDPVANRGVAYFACFMLCAGVRLSFLALGFTALLSSLQASSPSVLVATWYNNNTPHESRRAVVSAVNGMWCPKCEASFCLLT